MKKPAFITIEGPIGVGKSTLAHAISQAYGLQLLAEIVEENPFLGKFYENTSEWSFQTEMFFLCNRYKQLQDISHDYLSKGVSVVADYNLFKNKIFAKHTLSADNLQKFLQIYDILNKDLPKATLVIYLSASVETVMKRISTRGREIEQCISRDYLEQVNADYQQFFQQFSQTSPIIPTLRFDCDQLDFVQNPEDLDFILKQVEPYLSCS